MDKSKFIATTILTIIIASTLTFSFSQMPMGHAAELTEPEKALVFLREVALLDFAKYNVTFAGMSDSPVDLGALPSKTVKYVFNSSESSFDVLLHFKDGKLTSCTMYIYKGSPLITQPATNALNDAKSFLKRYQNYSGSPYSQTLSDPLNSLTELKSMTTVTGNVKLSISIDTTRTLFIWTYTVDGFDVQYNSASLGFVKGYFEGFSDNWNQYQLGSTEVKISKEQAIQIAKSAAYNSTFVVDNRVVTPNYTIRDSPVLATLSLQPKADNKLYPLWEFKLSLDRVILGSTGGFQVSLWADTGEVIFVTSMGMFVSPPDENNTSTPTPSTEPSPSSSPSPTVTDLSSSPIITPTASISENPTQQPTIEPSQLATSTPSIDVLYGPNTLPLTIGISTIAIVAVAGLLVYFKKIKKWKQAD
jgi:hypothetical protein